MALSIEQVLPEETLDHIVSFVSQDSLPSLCLASRTLCRLATAHLYSHITLRENIDLDALAYLLITSPAHSYRVKHLIVPENWTYWKRHHQWTKYGSVDAENKRIRASCSDYATNVEEIEDLYTRIQSNRHQDDVLAFLLAKLHNLRTLDIDFGMLEEHVAFHDLLKLLIKRVKPIDGSRSELAQNVDAEHSGLVRSTAFTTPIHVFATGTDDKYPNASQHITTFFNLPNLHSFYGWKFGDADELEPDENGPFAKLQPRSCPVEYIELRMSKVQKDNLQFLLDATIPGKLKTFNYEIGCVWAACCVDHPAIMRALAAHHETLENLGLSHEDEYPSEYTDDNKGEYPMPCSFTAFKTLKRLKVAPAFIWGHEGFSDETGYKDTTVRDMLWKALPERNFGLQELINFIPRMITRKRSGFQIVFSLHSKLSSI